MANCMLMPQMLSRMVCMWIPENLDALAWEDVSGDVFVQWGHNAYIQIAKNDRLLSLNAVEIKYKPIVDAKLIETWKLVDYEPPENPQWSAAEMAASLGKTPYSFNKIRSHD